MGCAFSVSFPIDEGVRREILAVAETSWQPAIAQDRSTREGAWVTELCGFDLSGWPPGSRAISRRERPHPGAQLSFTDHEGHRFQVVLTDRKDADIALLEARQRAQARCEDRICGAKDTGLCNLPLREFSANAVWLELGLMA